MMLPRPRRALRASAVRWYQDVLGAHPHPRRVPHVPGLRSPV